MTPVRPQSCEAPFYENKRSEGGDRDEQKERSPVVYVHSPDRLSRDSVHLLALKEEFASVGTELRFVRGAAGDAGSPVRGLYGYEYWPHGSSDEHGAEGAFNAVKLIFELAGEGWSFSRIAAELNGMESRSEPSE